MKALAKVLLVPLLLIGATASAQGYVLAQSSQAYVPMTGGTAVTFSSGLDEGSAVVPLGFTFKYGGTNYQYVSISANGSLELVASSSATATCKSYSYAGPFPVTCGQNVIAPWWGDLKGPSSGGGVKYTSASGTFTVEYQSWGYFLSAAPGRFSFMVKFVNSSTTGNDRVEVYYGDHTAGAGDDAVAGIQVSGVGYPFLPCASTSAMCRAADWPTNTLFILDEPVNPELLVDDVAVSNFQASGQAASMTLDVMFRNYGQTATTGVNWHAFLSKDNAISADDIKIYDSTTPGGAPVDIPSRASITGGTVTVSHAITVPALADGRYKVIVEVDPDNAVVEAVETNNLRTTTETYLVGVDVQADALDGAPANSGPGNLVTLGVSYSNPGTGPTGTVPFHVVLSADQVLSSNDLVVYQGTLSLTPGQLVSARQVDVILPNNSPGGDYYFGLVLDPVSAGAPTGSLAEADETNNAVFAAAATTITQADLVLDKADFVDALTGAPARAIYMGDTRTLSIAARNIGGANATGFSVGVVMSRDANLSLLSDWRIFDEPSTAAGGYTLSQCADIANPAACTSGSYDIPVTFPSTDRLGNPLTTGDYYFFVQLDSFEEVTEMKEDNNTKMIVGPVRLYVPTPDLATSRVQAPAASASGEIIPVFRVLKNVGVADSPAVKYRYFASVNGLVTEQDVPLELIVNGAPVAHGTVTLAKGAQDAATDFVRLPPGMAPGAYYVGAVVDSDNLVPELDEANNAAPSAAAMSVAAPALRITTQQLPDGAVDRPYLVRLVSTAAAGTATWSALSPLPAGMTLDPATGTLGGTPSLAGVFAFDLKAEASGRSALTRLVLRVLAGTSNLAVLTTALPPVINANQAYGASLSAAGGRRPYAWRVTTGALPKGLVLNADGTVSGTPLTAQNTIGEALLGVEVADASGNRATGAVKVRVVGAGALVIQDTQFPDAMVGSDYLADVQAAMADGKALSSPLTWTISAGTLPAGVTLSSVNDRGVFGGKALEAGTFSFTLQVEDGAGRVDTADHVVRIFPNVFRVSGDVAASYFPGDEVTLQLASTSASPVAYRLFSGELPPGLRMTDAGLVSGFINSDPEVSVGVYNVVISARSEDGAESFSALGFNVVRRPEAAGCSAGAGGPSAWLLALGLGALRLRRRKASAWLASFAALVALVPGAAFAQFTYSTQGAISPGTYTALTGANAGSVVYDGNNFTFNTGWVVALPFTFEFYGQPYDTVGVALQGYLDFLGTSLDTGSNKAIPHSLNGSPHVAIAPWWDTLYDQDSSPGPATIISTRTFGSAPNREFVIDWANVTASSSSTSARFSFQVRLFEGTNRVRFSYKPNASPSTGGASVGILGGLGVGLPGLSCTNSSGGTCSAAAYPAGKDIDFALPADLTVPTVSGDDTAYAGTIFRAVAALRNGGGTPAAGAKVRFFLSPDTELDVANDPLLGDSAAVDLAPGKDGVVSANVLVPQAIQPGAYYLFAVADPDNLLFEPNETNNVSPAVPLAIGAPRADLQVVALSTGTSTASPGQTLSVSRTISNTGNAAINAPVSYTYLISDNAVASYSDFAVVPAGSLASLNAGGSSTATDALVLPADLPAGKYWIGLCADYDPQANPVSTLAEISEVNNCYTAPQPVVVSTGALAVLSSALPTAAQLSPYGLTLEATGGNGTYTWVKVSGDLPPGMTLADSGLLSGTPSVAGTFSFTVKVTSGADEKSQNLNLTVAPGGLPLAVVDQDVPVAEFGKAYSAGLIAVGGKPPYTWTLGPNSQLPQGLALATDGVLEGRALEYRAAQGELWPFSVDVVDAAGVHAVKNLAVRVVASSQLQVATPRLATAYLARPYRADLRAIGGTGAVNWRLDRYQRISQSATEASGEPVVTSAEVDPAAELQAATGLSLLGDPANNRLWYLDGVPTQAGTWVLVFVVGDSAGVVDRTTLTLRISYDQALQLDTTALPDAFVGKEYSAKLASNAAEGVQVVFKVPCVLQVSLPDYKAECVPTTPLQNLPAGLVLGSDGTLSGVPEFPAEGISPPAVYSFLVQVSDSQGRYDVRSLSIKLRPALAEGGCSGTGTGPGGWLALGLVVLALAGRRRVLAAGVLGALALATTGCSKRDLCVDKKVVCEDGLTCDADDGVCKCGGLGGVVCASGTTCDALTNTCVSTRCANVECAGGTACDVFDGKCKCGGTGGTECADGTACDPVIKACMPLVDCRVAACPANQDCDAATGQCLCGAAACAAGEVCAVSEGGGRACAPSPCAGVNCAGATTCDPADGQCKCNGAVCSGGETCSCAAGAASCSATDRACTPSTLCTGVTCEGGTTCDPLDGQCKCGGPGGPVCGAGQICALGPPAQCQGGDQCALPDGGTKRCEGGTSCDPEDGVCKCGGRGGIVCQPASGATPAEVCVVTSAAASCKRGCDPRSPDCPGATYCYFDTLAKVSVSYCATATGSKFEGQACTAPAECFSQVPAPRAVHCLGLEPGQFGICRAYCDVQAGASSCSQVPRPQSCLQLPDAPANVGYCLPQ